MRKCYSLHVLTLILLLSLRSQAQDISWEQVNYPVDGDQSFFTSIIVTADGGILGATAEGPVYRSDDLAISWTEQSVSGRLFKRLPIDGITLLNGSIQRSGDEGLSWTKALEQLPAPQYNDYLRSPDGSAFVIVGGALFSSQPTGIFRSIDNGATWEQIFDSVGTAGIVELPSATLLCVIDVLEGSSDGVDIDRPAEIHRSTDGGDTWAQVALIDPDSYGWMLWAASKGTVFASANSEGAAPGRLFRSTDDGRSWHTATLQDRCMAIVEASDGSLYCSAINSGAYRSTDGGRHWSGISNGLVDPRIIPMALHNSGRLLTCDFFGRMYRSSAPVVSAPDQAVDITVAELRPNPAAASVSLRLETQRRGTLHVQLVSADGRAVSRMQRKIGTIGMQSIDLDLSSVSAGVYFCRIELGEWRKVLRLLVVP